jgi:hypothetical protein
VRMWLLVAVACLALASGRAEALSISLTSPSASVPLGGVALVDVWVSDVGEGQALRAFDLAVLFDQPPLGFASLVFDAALGEPGVGALVDGGPSGAGRVDLAANSFLMGDALLELQPAVFRLARIELAGLALGLANVTIGPAEMIGLGAILLPVDSTSGLSLLVVPEPGVVTALALGLALLAGCSGRRQ